MTSPADATPPSSPPPLQPGAADPWAQATFDGLELAQLRENAAIPFVQKLQWLEQMHRLSLKLQETRQTMGDGTRTVRGNGPIEDH